VSSEGCSVVSVEPVVSCRAVKSSEGCSESVRASDRAFVSSEGCSEHLSCL
jgi:hypothetical protein